MSCPNCALGLVTRPGNAGVCAAGPAAPDATIASSTATTLSRPGLHVINSSSPLESACANDPGENKGFIVGARGTRPAGREERSREYVTEEQRRPAGGFVSQNGYLILARTLRVEIDCDDVFAE